MSENSKKSDHSPNEEASGVLYLKIVKEIAACLAGSGIRSDHDIPQELEFSGDQQQFQQLVRSLVRSSVDALDGDGELSVTIWQAGETIEVEVADNGPALEDRPRFLPLAAAILQADMIWQACPQGGVAVTAVMPRNQSKRSVA